VAGLVFTLSPYHFLRLELGHLNLVSIQWIPFYLLFLFKFIETGRKRLAVLAVFFMVLNALCSWYYVMACGGLSLAALAWPKGRLIPWRQLALRVGLVLALSVAALLPLLWPMFGWLARTEWVGEHNPLRHSVDLLSFWVPGPPSAWATWFEAIWISYAAQNREPGASAYLGYSVIILGCFSLWGTQRKAALWWLVVGLGAAILAMGPQLQVNGQIFNFRLPYDYLSALPGFAISGIPGRLVVVTSLVTAILAGYGLSALTQRFPGKTGWFALAAGMIILAEFLAVPVSGSPTQLPSFYTHVAGDGQPYAIIDFKWDANYLLHAQTIHGKPLIGGWLARLPQEQAAYLEQGSPDKILVGLLLGLDKVNSAVEPAALQAALTARQVRYLIDHSGSAGPLIENLLGWPVVYSGEGIVVYQNKYR
jgi:hypothetical protein